MSRRRYRGTSRRNRRIFMPSDDDMDISLSLIAFLSSVKKTPTSIKKRPPNKRTTRAATRTVTATVTSSSSPIVIDDCPEAAQIINKVTEKVGQFMETGSFISSDEEETEMIRAKTNKKPTPELFFISDDSDDDCKMLPLQKSVTEIDSGGPSTSGTITNAVKNNNSSKKTEIDDDDIMGFVDSILCSNKNANTETPIKDIKSLEDFRKETEEMLKNASSLLDEIKTGRKAETETKQVQLQKSDEKNEKSNGVTCPVCLDPLANREASVTLCGHIFCKDCITQAARQLKKCPFCRKPINMKKIHPIYL